MKMKMQRKLTRFSKGMLFINIFVLFLILLVCLTPILPAGSFWLLALPGLVFPYLILLLLFFIIFWSIKRSKLAILSGIVLLLSFQQMGSLAAIRIQPRFAITRAPGTLRILSWNVSKWDERNKERRGGTSFRPLMMDCLSMQEADVLCLQEFFECHDPAYFESNIPELSKRGYPYHFFFPVSDRFEGRFQYGMAIFSRYPIIDSGRFAIEVNEHSEGLSFIDINTGGKNIRIFSMHLQSVAFTADDHENIGNVNEAKGILGKMKRGYRLRSKQAEMASAIINSSPHPAIVCGDLNDVPNSYAYFTIKNKKQDAFLKKGSGLGATYRFLSPTLRIDYILPDKSFKVEQFSIVKVPYSDHYPIIADVSLTK